MFDTTDDKNKMSAVIERFKDEMKKVRTGRAHPDMLSMIKVEAYGQFMPLNQVANVTAADATMLVITPFDPSNIQAISSAIRADQTLGLNPADDGRIVRVPIPALTEERRKEIVKNASEKVENAKVAIRNIREDARKAIKAAADLSEDVKKRAEKDIDDLTKEFSDKVDAEFKIKSDEIMKI
jgi:ribosome recycling factor